FSTTFRDVNQAWAYDNEGNRSDIAVNTEDQALFDVTTYDAIGAIATRGWDDELGTRNTYSYDLTGHLRSFSGSWGAFTASYDYDGAERLVTVRPGSPSASSPREEFIYRDQLNPVGWRRTTVNPSCPGGMDTHYFEYGLNLHTPDLMNV